MRVLWWFSNVIWLLSNDMNKYFTGTYGWEYKCRHLTWDSTIIYLFAALNDSCKLLVLSPFTFIVNLDLMRRYLTQYTRSVHWSLSNWIIQLCLLMCLTPTVATKMAQHRRANALPLNNSVLSLMRARSTLHILVVLTGWIKKMISICRCFDLQCWTICKDITVNGCRWSMNFTPFRPFLPFYHQ